jgi:hypothetical protein
VWCDYHRDVAAELLSEPLQAATNAGRLIPVMAHDVKFQIGCNIHQLTELCQHKDFRQKPTGTAGYLSNYRR